MKDRGICKHKKKPPGWAGAELVEDDTVQVPRRRGSEWSGEIRTGSGLVGATDHQAQIFLGDVLCFSDGFKHRAGQLFTLLQLLLEELLKLRRVHVWQALGVSPRAVEYCAEANIKERVDSAISHGALLIEDRIRLFPGAELLRSKRMIQAPGDFSSFDEKGLNFLDIRR